MKRFGPYRATPRAVIVSSLLLLSCGEKERNDDAATGQAGLSRPSSPLVSPRRDTSLPAARPAKDRWDSPRTAAAIELREIARRGGITEPDLLLRPVDVKITAFGTLIADFGSASIKSFRTLDGATAFDVGRRGRGPSEFVGPPQLLGSYRAPMAFQGEGGRISRLADGEIVGDERVPSTRPWLSACQLSERALLLQSTPRPRSDPFFIATFGVSPTIEDSLAHPWPRIRELPPIARQTPIAQADDSTCVLLPLLHQELAIITHGLVTSVGKHPELLPPAVAAIDQVKEGTRYQVAKGAVYGARGATVVGGQLGILFEGRSPDRTRVIDLFTRELEYIGSVRLPFETRAIAGHADTLAVVGYENDYPVLVIYAVSGRH